jgi:hypothetical protein
MFKLPVVLGVTALFLANAHAEMITTLNFTSPGTASPLTITAGGSVTFDLGVFLNPIPATTGVPEFVDLSNNSAQVSSCAAVTHCEEIEFDNTASTQASGFPDVEVLAATAPGPPTFYTFTSLGTFSLTITYPNVGLWEITTAGEQKQEQFTENECTTVFTSGTALGPAVCTPIQSFVGGTLDPGGAPELFVNVVAPGTAVPEPSYEVLLCGLLLGVPIVLSRRHRARST